MGVIAGELRRFLETLAKIPYAPRQEDIRALAEFIRAARRAAQEEAATLWRGSSSSALQDDEMEPGDLRSVQAAFASAIYGMATSRGTLRERVASALIDLVPLMSRRRVPDETTAVSWEALVAPLSSLPLPQAIAALSEAEVQRAATAICNIDARLRWLIR